jgi:hypothetical protein
MMVKNFNLDKHHPHSTICHPQAKHIIMNSNKSKARHNLESEVVFF